MTDGCVKYSKGYRYQLQDDAVFRTSILGYNVVTEYVCLSPNGVMWLKRGYATDGITGISGTPWAWLLEKKWLLFASFGHDGLYQLLKLGFLPEEFRDVTDRLLERWCLEAKAWKWQAGMVYKVVHDLGDGVVEEGMPEILTAP